MKITSKYTDLAGSHHVKKHFSLHLATLYTNTCINVEAIGEAC